MDDDSRIARAHTFDRIAEIYDQSGRGYPEELFDDLFASSRIGPENAAILEIGCGTGQATLPLARRGCRIVCVEMGENLARIARRNLASFPSVTVVTSRFEDWDPRGASFDIVFAATSWHWIDPRVRYAKAANALRPGGVLAFTTGGQVFPPGFDPFFTQIQDAYEAVGMGRLKP